MSGELRPRTLFVILRDPSVLVPPVVVIPHVAWRGRVTLLAAREKSGKSTLLAAGAAAISRGDSFLGKLAGSGDVLWWSADNEAIGDIARRFVRFQAEPVHVLVLEQRPAALTDLEELIATYRPALFVVDTLAASVAGLVKEASGSAEWQAIMPLFTRIARDNDCAVVLVHHAAKASGEYRDSTAIGAIVDQIVIVDEVVGEANARRVKSRGRCGQSEITVRLTDNDFELDAGLPALDARVMDYIERNPGQSGRAIRDGVGGRREEVPVAIRKLYHDGFIENRGTDRYAAWHRVVPVVPAASGPPAMGNAA